ncbi:DNA-3-methyladenine glycosylase family protein [Azospirillum thermophilum]|uniref:DNA-3-methyladenine glycosylase family protein n=1 Tax=Azospirillum thermophilum TaxID=2202148 RepID=UPI001FEC5A43|nr:hypothetical protein [Azospirillum thermophilum]
MTVQHLSTLDPIFAECLRVGGPALRDFSRPAGFVGLLRIVMEQQLSTRVALALWDKLQGRLGGVVTPDSILAADDDLLRDCGFSRQKTGYARALAEAVAGGRIDLDAVAGMEDEEAIAALTALKASAAGAPRST